MEKTMAGFDFNKISLNNPIIRKFMSAMIRKTGDAAAPVLQPRDYKRVGSKRIKIEMPDGVKFSAFLTKPKENCVFPAIHFVHPKQYKYVLFFSLSRSFQRSTRTRRHRQSDV